MNDIIQDESPDLVNIDANEVLKSVQINTIEEVQEDYEETANIQKVEVEVSSDEDNIVSSEAQELYAEFSSFMENKTDIVPDKSVKEVIPTGIDIVDGILGGGFVVGGMSIIVGAPGSGKSMLAAKTLGAGQKKYQGDLIAAFLDSEQSMTKMRLSNLGVKYPPIDPYDDVTVEKVFKFIEGLCLFKQEKKILDKPSAIVWDSIANTLSQKERETDDPNTVIGYKARLLSILVPKYVAKCAEHGICFLCVNQLRDVIDMGRFSAPKDLKFMTASKSMPGGNILKFNAFQLCEMRVKTAFNQDATIGTIKYGFDGFVAYLKCVKNKLFAPNIQIEIVGSYNTGFSNFWTNYKFLADTKRMHTGAWNYLLSAPTIKFRTKDAMEIYNTNPDFKFEYDKTAKEGIQTDIIDKYTVE